MSGIPELAQKGSALLVLYKSVAQAVIAFTGQIRYLFVGTFLSF